MNKPINKKNYPNYLFLEDVDDVFNEIHPLINEIIKIPVWDGMHISAHKHLSFQEQMWSYYRNRPLSVQPDSQTASDIAEAKAVWKNYFKTIVASSKSLMILTQIKKTSLSDDSTNMFTSGNLIYELNNFDNWTDVTDSQTSYAGAGQTTYKNKNKTAGINNNIAVNSILEQKTDDSNYSDSMQPSPNEQTTEIAAVRDATFLKIFNSELKTINNQTKVRNASDSIDKSLNTHESDSNNLSVNTTKSRTETKTSNNSKDYLGFFDLKVPNFRKQYLALFSELFRYYY